MFEQCTKNKEGRLIEQSEYMDLIDQNKKRLQQNPQLYLKRQSMVEHPFGVIKRQWDFYYIMTKKSISRATADVGLIFTAYNLKRLFNILDKNTLKAYLKAICLLFPALFYLIRGRNRHFKTTNAAIQNKYSQISNPPKALLPPLFCTDFKNIRCFEMGF